MMALVRRSPAPFRPADGGHDYGSASTA